MDGRLEQVTVVDKNSNVVSDSDDNTTTTMFLMSICQALAGAFRTGNPLLDGILTSVLIAVSTTAMMYAKSTTTRMCNMMWRLLSGSRGSYTVRIDKYTTEYIVTFKSKLPNMYFDAFSWFLCNRCTFDAKYTVLYDTSTSTNGRRAFFPHPDYPVWITLRLQNRSLDNTARVRIVLKQEYDRNGQDIQQEYFLVTMDKKTDCMRELQHLMDDIKKEYNTHMRSTNWVQKVFRIDNGNLRHNPDNNEKTVTTSSISWMGQPSHNAKTFDVVVIDDDTKRTIDSDLTSFLNSEEWYCRMGQSYQRGYLFYGPPGTGKTSLVRAMSLRAGYDIYAFDLARVTSNTELDEAFDKLPEKCLVLFEDVDCMSTSIHTRNTEEPPHQHHRNTGVSLSAILNNIDGVRSNHGRIFVFTTNHPDVLDPALTRCGRVDISLRLDNCTHDQIRRLFSMYYGDNLSYETRDSVQELCACAPERALSPAQITSTLRRHKDSPMMASRDLKKMKTSISK